jgi:hypothetical protein
MLEKAMDWANYCVVRMALFFEEEPLILTLAPPVKFFLSPALLPLAPGIFRCHRVSGFAIRG